CLRGFKVRGVEDHERSPCAGGFIGLRGAESAIDPGRFGAEAGVVGTVVDEAPGKSRRIKLLGAGNAGHGKFNVVDLVVMCGLAHDVSPVRVEGRGVKGKARRHTFPGGSDTPPSTIPQKQEKAGRARWLEVRRGLPRYALRLTRRRAIGKCFLGPDYSPNSKAKPPATPRGGMGTPAISW